MTWRPLRGPAEGEDPRGLRPSLDRLTQRLGAPAPTALTAIFARWEEAVGPTIADHAQPVSLREGVLVVRVDEPGWATQLRYLANDVLRRLDEAAGAHVADRLEVRVGHGRTRG